MSIDIVKTCPFCGSGNLEDNFSSKYGYYISCHACKAEGPKTHESWDINKKQSMCITLWNESPERKTIKINFKPYDENPALEEAKRRGCIF